MEDYAWIDTRVNRKDRTNEKVSKNLRQMRSYSNKATVIIPRWNGKSHLLICLKALSLQEYSDFEVIVVDNGSNDGSIELIRQAYQWVKLIRFDRNQGFAAACNAGIAESNAEYIVLLNNDTKPSPEWIGELIHFMDSAPPDVACLSSKMLRLEHPDLIDDAGDILTWRGGAFKRGHGKKKELYDLPEEVMSPCAGAALYKRTVLKQIGGMDETFFAYLEDVDLGLRIRLAGYHCFFIPKAIVYHVGHGSSLPREQYVFLTSRNRLFLYIKNIPAILLFTHFGSIVYGWVFFFLAFGLQKSYLKGTLSFFKLLPVMLNKRKAVRSLTKLSTSDIDALLSSEWPEISLLTLLKNYIRRH